MVRSKILSCFILSAGIIAATQAQDDVYYNPNQTKNNSGSSNSDYQQQYESNPKQEAPASNPADYDSKNDGYSTGGQDKAYQYDERTNNNNNEYYSDSYYDDDDYMSSWNYSSRLRRYYTPNYGVSFFSDWYDPFYWYQPVVVVNYGYRNPWYSSWRYDMCYSQPWRCNVNNYNFGYNPYSNWGWNSPCFGGFGYSSFGYGYGGGYYGYPYNYGYFGGYYGGYNNFGYGYGNGGYGYHDYGYNQPQYSYSGPRHRTGAAGSNTSDGQIHRATGRTGKTDETEIPREGIVKPTPGRGNVVETNKRPTETPTPNTNPNVNPRTPEQMKPRTQENTPVLQPRQPQTRPMEYDQKPREQAPVRINNDDNLKPRQEMQERPRETPAPRINNDNYQRPRQEMQERPRETPAPRINNDNYQRPRQEMQERPRETPAPRINNDNYQRPRQEMQERPRETPAPRINNDNYQRPRQEMQERPREIQPSPRQEMRMNDGGGRNMGGSGGGNGGRSRGR